MTEGDKTPIINPWPPQAPEHTHGPASIHIHTIHTPRTHTCGKKEAKGWCRRSEVSLATIPKAMKTDTRKQSSRSSDAPLPSHASQGSRRKVCSVSPSPLQKLLPAAGVLSNHRQLMDDKQRNKFIQIEWNEKVGFIFIYVRFLSDKST